MDESSNDDSFLNSNQQAKEVSTSTHKTSQGEKSFNKVSSIDKLNKSQSKSQANISSNLQQDIIQEETYAEPMNQVLDDSQLDLAVVDESQPEEVAQVIQPPTAGSNIGKKPKKKFTNENNSSSDEGSNGQFPYESQMDTDNMPSFIPANPGLYNNRRVMTAPDGKRRRGGKSTDKPPILSGAFHQTFVESDLMKAANIYQQFDKKGNLYENRLYAKTSINQAIFNKDQNVYDRKMENHPDEQCRINNGSQYQDGLDAEKSFGQNPMNKSQKDGSINMTQNASVSINEQIKMSNQQSSITGGYKSGVRTTNGLNFGRSPNSALSARNLDMKFTQLSGGTITGGTFGKANGPKVTKKGPLSQSTLIMQIEARNIQNNKDMSMTQQAKSQSNMQFTNVQKSLSRLQNLGTYNAAWSKRDYDPKYVTGGIGGAQNTFIKAHNLQTNDPSLFKEKGYNETSKDFRPGQSNEMMNTFYHYYGEGDQEVKVLDLPDKKSSFKAGRYMNATGRTFYGKQLDNKGRSKIAFTERDHAAGYNQAINKIQKKAYRANTQSRQVDGLYNETKFNQRPSYINYTRSDFNILRPCHNVKQLSVSLANPQKLVESMRAGKCHQVYGISDFNQNNRSAGLKYHEKYQGAYNKDQQMFRRTNGEFTQHQNALKYCKF